MEQPESLSPAQRCGRFIAFHWRGIIIFFVPLIAMPLLFVKPKLQYYCAYVLVLMAVYWVSEVIPLYVTSLIPIVLLPVMGILSSHDVCLTYFKDSLILFFGGLIVALTIEYCNLHKRVALNVIYCVGCSPRRLLFSLMMVSMFVSMWISNASTTAMMCPIIKAVLDELKAQGMAKLEREDKKDEDDDRPYPSSTVVCFYMSVAYASSNGGIGTLIGTGTNLVFKGIYDGRFPEAQDLDFLNFMLFTTPIMFVQTVVTFFALQWHLMGLGRPNSAEAAELNVTKEGEKLANDVIKVKKDELGPVTCHEIQVGILFLLLITMFLTRKPGIVMGWADVLDKKKIKNSVPVIFVLICLFIFPIKYTFCKYFYCRHPPNDAEIPSLVAWKFINKENPWGMLLLLGGGFALSEGIKVSGFAIMVGNAMRGLQVLPPPLVQLFSIVAGVVTTAFTANMAMCNILVPVLLEIATVIHVHPMYLGLPATLALSMAFHLPVSTPANAIAAAFANIRTKDMAIAGILPSLISITGIFLFSQSWGYIVFSNMSTFPEWASHTDAPPT